MAVCAFLVTLPALTGDENNYTVRLLRGGLDHGHRALHRLRDPGLPALAQGDSFEPGPWTLGKKYKWVNPAAVLWVIICVIIFSLPFSRRRACPGTTSSTWSSFNYAPVTVGGRDPRRRALVADLRPQHVQGPGARRSRPTRPARDRREAAREPAIRRARERPGVSLRAVTIEELSEGGRGRHRRHRAARDRRHGGAAAGQAADRHPLPRRGGRARRRGLQLPARRRRRHGHGRRLRDVVVGARLRRLRDEARPRHAAAGARGTRAP